MLLTVPRKKFSPPLNDACGFVGLITLNTIIMGRVFFPGVSIVSHSLAQMSSLTITNVEDKNHYRILIP